MIRVIDLADKMRQILPVVPNTDRVMPNENAHKPTNQDHRPYDEHSTGQYIDRHC